MLRTRLLLVLAGILSASWCFGGFYWANNSHSNDLGVASLLLGFGMFFGPILFLAATLMLVFSFFRVNEVSDGRLEYDPSSYHWRLLKKCFELEGNISLCKAYWLTTLVTFFTVIFTGAAVLFSYMAYTEGVWKVIVGFKVILLLAAFMGSFCIPVIFRVIWPKSEFVSKFSLFLLVAIIASWVVVLPFYTFLYRDGLTMSASMWKYLTAIGEMSLMVISIYAGLGLILLLAKYFSSRSSDSLLKRLFTTLKENMCPILYEHSTAGK